MVKKLYVQFKDITHIGAANILSTITSGIFWFYIAKLMGADDYGEVSYLIAMGSIGSVIASVGTSNVMTVYVAKKINISSTLYALSLISGTIVTIVIYFLFNNLALSVYILGSVLFTLMVNELLGLKLYRKYSNFILLQRVFGVIFSLVFFYILGPEGIVLGFALSFFPFVSKIKNSIKKNEINFKLVKMRASFLLNSYALDLNKVFVGYLDKIIIGPFFGFVLLGNYQLGYQFLTLLNLIPSTVFQYILPQEASGISKLKIKFITIIFSVISALLGIFIGPHIVKVFFPKFEEASSIIMIMSPATIPISINLMYISKLLANEKVKSVLIGSVVFILVQITGIFFLGNIYQIQGIAMAILLAASAESIYLSIIYRMEKITFSNN
jgi:O-antigen/teichoic acid export membrane protein